jgi:putative ABC transport system ATP-binding protein
MISVRALSMRLTSGGRAVDVLTDVSLEVPAGQFVAIAGPSGSGKSTLLGLIAGLDQPTAGRIEVAGVVITDLDEDALARFRADHVGYVFQSFHLIPTLTALENVAVPLELAGAPDAAARATALLGEVGLAERAHHYPVQLSGGEQQRVAVARALARRPPLLLADDPPATSTPRPASRSSSCWWARTGGSAARSCWSPTTRRSRPTPTG